MLLRTAIYSTLFWALPCGSSFSLQSFLLRRKGESKKDFHCNP